MSYTKAAVTIESHESAPAWAQQNALLWKRRRHSSYHHPPRSLDAVDTDVFLLKVDLFLSELVRRLDFLESYGQIRLDAGIASAYATLETVRDSCSHASGELIGAGRRRAHILLETLEAQYHGAWATKDTVEQKLSAGMRLLEDFLADCEERAQSMGEVSRLGAMAGDLMDQGRRKVDEGLEKAKGVVDDGLEKAKGVVDDGLERAKGVVDDGLERARRAKASLGESIERAMARAQEHGLIRYDDLPQPWQVNPHIRRGYRFSATKVDCLRSVLTVFSNETVNIWSHAVGLVVVLALALHWYPSSVNFSASAPADVAIAAVFFLAAAKCLVCSAVWHTMSSIAQQSVLERFACVDYSGISLLIAASIITTEYTAFYCEPASRRAYMAATAALGLAGIAVSWHPRFNGADMSAARVAFYVGLALSGFLPLVQLAATRGPAWCLSFYAPVFKSIAVYLLGACVYAAKIPERWRPGLFDYVGGSHNLWHLAVLAGIFFHYLAMQEFFAGAFRRARTDGCHLA
ncbi:MAG: hypothetical protein M1826_004763 [Phylliscum demangeonii]|nr:MAG: hypothetical protein M1826_004763 [Phylliscum demangeonii]